MTATTSPRQPPLLADRTFRTADHVVSTRHADTTVLLDARRGVCYTLNELGWRIWDQLTAEQSVATIVRTLRQEYRLPASAFEADVAAFIERLLGASLIEQTGG